MSRLFEGLARTVVRSRYLVVVLWILLGLDPITSDRRWRCT
jgi:hypothetical protein